MPPVGRSLWRKRAKDGDLVGIKAKTQYLAKRESWALGDPWAPDKMPSLVQAGLFNRKAIGFLRLKVRLADAKASEKHGWPENALVTDEWLLLEYAVRFLAANQDALIESVSKAGLDLPAGILKAVADDVLAPVIARGLESSLAGWTNPFRAPRGKVARTGAH